MKWTIRITAIIISITWVDEAECTRTAIRTKRYGEIYPDDRARVWWENTQPSFAEDRGWIWSDNTQSRFTLTTTPRPIRTTTSQQFAPTTTRRPARTTTSQKFAKLQEENPCDWKLPQRPNFNNVGRRISKAQCAKYVWDIWAQEENKTRDIQCTLYILRKQGVGGYIGGRNSEPAEFPHLGAIGWKSFNGNWIFKCGSTLLSPNYVLTAGHCTYSARDINIVSPIPQIVRLGVTSLSSVSNKENAVDVDIQNIIKHPDYAPPSRYNDIALMQLNRNVEMSLFIQPACLWTDFDTSKIGTTISGAGWGVTNTETKETADILQTGELDVIDSNICNKLFARFCDRQWCGMQPHQMCAGKLTGGVDSCQGDSGGPLQAILTLPNNLYRKMYYILGVTSFGFGCARPNSPGLYSRVSSFVDWIERIVWAEEK